MDKRTNWPMPVVILLAATGLILFYYTIYTPEANISPASSPISYHVLLDKDGQADKAHLVWGMFWTPTGKELDVHLVFRSGDAPSFEEIPMERVRGTKVFVGSLPGREKGETTFYYIRAKDSQRNEEVIPAHAPEKPLFTVTFNGSPEKWALIIHSVLTLGALFTFFCALYYAFRILGGLALKRETTFCYRNTLAGWIALAVAALPLGIYISLATFGKRWIGWPTDHSIAAMMNILLVIYWAVPVLLFRRNTAGAKALSRLVVIGSFLTGVMYFFPYYRFFQ